MIALHRKKNHFFSEASMNVNIASSPNMSFAHKPESVTGNWAQASSAPTKLAFLFYSRYVRVYGEMWDSSPTPRYPQEIAVKQNFATVSGIRFKIS